MPKRPETNPLVPFWQTTDGGSLCRLYCGDVIDVLRRLPSQSVQCVVTSPPYWGLRDYRTGTWEGGNKTCNHMSRATGGNVKQGKNKGNNGEPDSPFGAVCGICGALRVEDKQIGIERTPEEFVAKLVAVFAEVRRVLRDNGTIWLNLGDTYNGGPPGSLNSMQSSNAGSFEARRQKIQLPSGNLVGIPWRVALALQSDGWVLRQDIIWHKPSPMPESVQNRCTKSHEYIFLLAKSMGYYYDAEAIKTPAEPCERVVSGKSGSLGQAIASGKKPSGNAIPGSVMRSGDLPNRRSVWTAAAQSYRGGHFATFPTAIVEPCILAGSQPGDIILDPFIGSGTTAAVAIGLGRRCWGIDLSDSYLRNNAIVRIEGELFSRPALAHLAGKSRHRITR